MSPRRGLVVVLSFLLSAAVLAVAPSATASDDETARGHCDDDSTWRVRVYVDDNDRLDVIGTVFSDDLDLWSWRLLHEGDVSAKDDVRAKDADRSLRVERTMIDVSGTDDVVFRAQNNKTGEVCRGELDF